MARKKEGHYGRWDRRNGQFRAGKRPEGRPLCSLERRTFIEKRRFSDPFLWEVRKPVRGQPRTFLREIGPTAIRNRLYPWRQSLGPLDGVPTDADQRLPTPAAVRWTKNFESARNQPRWNWNELRLSFTTRGWKSPWVRCTFPWTCWWEVTEPISLLLLENGLRTTLFYESRYPLLVLEDGWWP